eukprot:TRINITY_DN1843_c0_g2_i1.p1 TRINITY_DN1843_c0_g2~~TRINITY_DN1843_c0_g2_i1.p1  ORF type:complete len:205 (+),score=28.65 TRINITY_DN1843_c0_g2_i1:34-615(+)
MVRQAFFSILYFFSFALLANAVYPNCIWISPNGSKYDLSPLAALQDYSFNYTSGNTNFGLVINFCKPVSIDCNDPLDNCAACQTWNDASTNSRGSIGTLSTMAMLSLPSMFAGLDGVTLSYTGGFQDRTSEFYVTCAPYAIQPIFNFLGENPIKHYNFRVKSLYACPLQSGSGRVGPASIITLFLLPCFFLLS